jgi:poly(3-hydroxybutyrate) depolymerase
MDRSRHPPLASLALLWPAVTAVAVGGFAGQMMQDAIASLSAPNGQPPHSGPEWTTPNVVARELSTVRLRDFSTAAQGVPTLLCAPYALHAADILDFAARHSVVEALRQGGCGRVFVTDWRSATAAMRFYSIDTYLSELNVLVDDLGGTVDLVGVCQGGWLALTYAARFPRKVRKLVLVAAPVDLAAGESRLSRLAKNTPLAVFQNMVALGEGRMAGTRLLDLWGSATPDCEDIANSLQVGANSPDFEPLAGRFRDWYARPLDLPGTYYLEAVERLFKRNELAAGSFVALGETIDLARVRCPIYLLAANENDVVAPAQAAATEGLIGTPREQIRTEVAATSHLGLFLGRSVIADEWSRIARWLVQPTRQRRRARTSQSQREPVSDRIDVAPA